MNWDFFEIVEEGMSKGYKSKWAIYRAIEFHIDITLQDIKELGEIYGHKKMWAYYVAQEFGLLKKKPDEPKKERYPENYFINIFNKNDLKKTYREWSKKLHPDIETGNQKEFIKMKNQYDSMKKRMIHHD